MTSATELDAILAKLSNDDRRKVDDALYTDDLTGLKNRRYFDRRLDMERGRGSSLFDISLVMIDIDHFKKVNDEYGHAKGDEVLRGIGEIIGEFTRDNDYLLSARYGGEELCVVLSDADVGNGYFIAERIRREIESSTIVTISAGVSGLSDCGSIDKLFLRADEALYAAKAAGRNRINVYMP